MRRILHWFLACLPWTILLSFRSTSFFIHCSFHRFIEFPLVSPLISLVSKKFLQRSKTCLPFHTPFSFQKLINRSLSSTLMNENIRETIRIWYGIDSKWIDLKRSAISSRLNKIISFPFLYISRDTPFYRDKRFIKTELCTTSLDPFSVCPLLPTNTISTTTIFIFISRSFLRRSNNVRNSRNSTSSSSFRLHNEPSRYSNL